MAEQEIEIDEDMLDELTEATDYTVGVNQDEGLMRFQFHADGVLLASMILTTDGAYQMAQRILRAYDQLEGL